MKCHAYHDDINFLGERGICWGTKEEEACSCGGDESKCDFYDYVRKRATLKQWNTKKSIYFQNEVITATCPYCNFGFNLNGNLEDFNFCPHCGKSMNGYSYTAVCSEEVLHKL